MTKTVTCEYDACCIFTTESSNARYCPVHRCKRPAESAAKKKIDGGDDLMDNPLNYRVYPIRDLPDGYRVVILNDLQIPFEDRATLEPVEKFLLDFAADLEIYNGDIIDFYSISDFNKNPSRRFQLQDELDKGRAWLERIEGAPRRILIEGNHEDRLRRWLWKHGPEMSSLRALTLESLLGLDEMNIEVVNYCSIVDLLGFRIEHGYKTAGSSAYPVNVSRWMAVKTASSGLCGHTHRFSQYAWTDSRGTHSYIENGCLCLDLEYAPFPNWQQAFTYGIVQKGKLHTFPTQIYSTGFMANGEFYPRRGA